MPERMPLRGRVVEHDGRPAAGATVTVRRSTSVGPTAFWGGTATSDVAGGFEMVAEEGDYLIQVHLPDSLAGEPWERLAYRLEPGARPAELRLSTPTFLVLSARKPDGAAIGAAPLFLCARNSAGAAGEPRYRYDAFAVPDGKRLRLGPEPLVLAASFDLGWAVVDCRQVAPGADHARQIQLQKGGTLRLRAVEASLGIEPRPVAGARPLVGTPQGATDDDGMANLIQWEAGVRGLSTGADGWLALENLRPGLYEVGLNLDGFSRPALATVEVKAGAVAEHTFPFARSQALISGMRAQ